MPDTGADLVRRGWEGYLEACAEFSRLAIVDLVRPGWESYLEACAEFRRLADSSETDSFLQQRFGDYLRERGAFARSIGREFRVAGEQAAASARESDRLLALDTALGASGDFCSDMLKLVSVSADKGWDTGRALAFSLRQTSLTREAGELAMGLIAARRSLWQFARESFAACGIETLARYQLENAMRAFLITDDPKAADVARTGLALLTRGGLDASAWDMLRAAEHCAALGLDEEMEGFLRGAETRGDRS